MRVRHPGAGEGESVNVDGNSVPVEDGTFEVPDDATGWLDRWCNANGYDRESVVLSGSSSEPTDGSDGNDSGDEADSEEYDGRPRFDPADYSVADLRSKLSEEDISTDELVDMKMMEDDGKNRKTALEAIQSAIEEE